MVYTLVHTGLGRCRVGADRRHVVELRDLRWERLRNDVIKVYTGVHRYTHRYTQVNRGIIRYTQVYTSLGR